MNQAIDLIGRTEFVDKICSLVQSLAEGEHMCLAINGEWGSGKSFVVQLLQDSFSQKENNVVIRYDAWENSFYSDPLIAILYCILDGLGKLLKKYDKPTIKDKAKALGTAAVGIAEAASEVAESVVGVDCVDILKDSISPIKELIKALSKSQKDNALFEEYTSYHELVNRIKDILNKITASSTKKQADKSRRLIILVDEVDRCLPDEQLRILERLHHLFDINNHIRAFAKIHRIIIVINTLLDF